MEKWISYNLWLTHSPKSCRRRGMRSEIVGGVGVREKEKGRMKSGRIESQEECKERSQGKMNYL